MDILLETKKRLTREFLGVGGVHAFGLDLEKRKIRVYLDSSPHPDGFRVLAAIRKAAAPFGIVVVREERPMAT